MEMPASELFDFIEVLLFQLVFIKNMQKKLANVRQSEFLFFIDFGLISFYSWGLLLFPPLNFLSLILDDLIEYFFHFFKFNDICEIRTNQAINAFDGLIVYLLNGLKNFLITCK